MCKTYTVYVFEEMMNNYSHLIFPLSFRNNVLNVFFLLSDLFTVPRE